MTENTLLKAYQTVAYPSLTFAQTHPNNLAVIARLFDVHSPAVNSARVLELGCGVGGNLLPMAIQFPQAHFVGIDFAQNQIDEGQKSVHALGLRNVQLHTKDILEIGPEFGQFDYIIAHGVYSWTPPIVRDKVLAICRENLSPNGIAYISYNTYPGWHMLESIRNVMFYHIGNESDPLLRAEKARTALRFLADSIPTDEKGYADFLKPYVQFLQHQQDRIGPKESALLLHDEIAEINDPIYFHQFVAHAERHQLQYVAEAQFSTILPTRFTPQVQENLRHMATNLLEMEQYMDFLLNRMFRQTLLCHESVNIQRRLDPSRLFGLHMSSRAQSTHEKSQPDHPKRETFRSLEGASLTTDHPVTKMALTILANMWPKPLGFSELFEQAYLALPRSARLADEKMDRLMLASNLLQGYTYGGNLIYLFVEPPQPVTLISAKPIASPLARWQAQHDTETTNLYHERIQLEDVARFILPYLDGTYTQAHLLKRLQQWAKRGGLKIEQDGQKVTERAKLSSILQHELQLNLRWLANVSLLIG